MVNASLSCRFLPLLGFSRLTIHTVFQPSERQKLIDRQREIMKSMLAHPRYDAFRQYKKNEVFQKLKKFVGPLFPTDQKESGALGRAFFDLFAVTDRAIELSIELWLSRLTFQYVWSDTGAKFSADAHNPIMGIWDAATLESRKFRLKLVITPGITMRSDKGTSIVAKTVKRADVLVVQ